MERVDPDGCSLPFLYDNKQYNQCIAVTQNSTPQCATSSGQLADCIVPTGELCLIFLLQYRDVEEYECA